MTERKSAWQTESLARTYLQGIRGAIPAADLQLQIIRIIVESWCPGPASILDLGCGDGPIGRMLLQRFPNAFVIFADFSKAMLEAARRQIADQDRASVIEADFSSPDWLDRVAEYQPFDVIVSGFAIHHQPDNRKRDLYTEICGALEVPGVFLNLEHVASATPQGETLFESFFVDHLYSFHQATGSTKTRAEIQEAYCNRPDKKENILAPVDEQCRWLREIGFEDVDCFFKVFELALFGGRKTFRT
ncbi:MAG: class I SAM-dependent methyltransferase [Deltaproteobacteria bacterium]|nr:class I SAM-dependent methyltransferase [Deltaproteobacteria bacterium]